MQRYSDINRNSGVMGFDINDTSITVYFKGTAKPYVYSYRKAGRHHVDQMKYLAMAGDGLNEYINENVRKTFD
jgi:archaellin